MAGAETLKQTTAHAAMEAAKILDYDSKWKSRRQALGAAHHNTAEAMRPQTGGSSLRQLVFDSNTKEVHGISKTKNVEWRQQTF